MKGIASSEGIETLNNETALNSLGLRIVADAILCTYQSNSDFNELSQLVEKFSNLEAEKLVQNSSPSV